MKRLHFNLITHQFKQISIHRLTLKKDQGRKGTIVHGGCSLQDFAHRFLKSHREAQSVVALVIIILDAPSAQS